MKLAIYSDCRDMINAIDAMSINNQSASDASLKNSVQIRLRLNTKMSTIKGIYEIKEQETFKIIP